MRDIYRKIRDLLAPRERRNAVLLFGMMLVMGFLEVLGVASVMPFIVWMQPLNAVVFVLDGIFLGAERFRYLAVQMAVSALVAACVLLLVIPRGWGLTGVWWGLVALMVTRIVTLLAGYFGARSRDRLTT